MADEPKDKSVTNPVLKEQEARLDWQQIDPPEQRHGPQTATQKIQQLVESAVTRVEQIGESLINRVKNITGSERVGHPHDTETDADKSDQNLRTEPAQEGDKSDESNKAIKK